MDRFLFLFCCVLVIATVNGLTFGNGDYFSNAQFFSVSSATVHSTGKRTEDGGSLHVISLQLPHLNQPLELSLQSMEDPSPECRWTRKFGEKVVDEQPCPRLEAYKGVGEDEHLSFLAYIDSGRTMMKGFFHLEGERYFIDPTFEHITTLKTLDQVHLTTQPMVVYKEIKAAAQGKENSQENNDVPDSAINQQKRGVELVSPATTTVTYPASPFGSGQCTMRKTITVRYHLDHSFVNRFKSDRATFGNPFPEGGSNDWQTWNDITSFVRVYGLAISKFVYEKSVGITMVIDKVEIHDTAGDAAWNQAGTSSVDSRGNNRYKCPLDINGILDTYTKWVQASNAPAGSTGALNHLITDCQRLFPGEGGTVGLAWVGVICSASNTGTCTFLPGVNGYQCSAHELGHNFGAPHDFRTGNQDIMSYQSKKYDGFSDNTYNAICSHLSSRGYKCLKDSSSTTPTCTPQCNGKICGSDGCGGLCGQCKAGQSCTAQGTCQTTCTPNCLGKKCGSDGCGGSCGTCAAGVTCGSNGLCPGACVPNCANKGCGWSDGCNGFCGTGCDLNSRAQGYICDATTGWKCSPPTTKPTTKPPCTPNCSGKICGPDGCGGVCGVCGQGTTCNTLTNTCSCVPVTSCVAQKKSCGQIYDGCKYVTCGPNCSPVPCTPNPNACLNKNCGMVSDGCKMIECGKCASQGTSMVCVNNKCTASDVCGWCSPFAQCVNRQSCVCRSGYTGNGFTCTPASVPHPESPDSWITDYGSRSDWSLSPDGKFLSNIRPSTDTRNPSIIRWKGSQSLVSVTDVTISAQIRINNATSIAGIAFGLDSQKNYGMMGFGNSKVMARAGSGSGSSSWYSLGSSSFKFDPSRWVNVTLVFLRRDASTTTLKTYIDGQVIPINCEAGCIGYNVSSMFPFTTLSGGDIGFYSMGVTDFTGLRVSSKSTVRMTLGNCVQNTDDLQNTVANLMGVDTRLVSVLDNPCKKRSVEQEEITMSILVDQAGPLESAGVGPSTMAAELEVGGAVASSAETLSITASAEVSAGVATSSVIEAVAVEESVILGSAASSGLSTAAIAGIAVGSLVGAVVLGAAGYVAVKKMSEDSGSGDSPKQTNMVLFNDAPPSSAPSSVPAAPKGGIDVFTNSPGDHKSITARGVPLQHGNK